MHNQKKKIKILFTIPNVEISGAERQLILLVKNIDKIRFDVSVCSIDGGGPLTDCINKLGITCYEIKRSKSFDISRLTKLYKIIKTNRYDFIVPFCWSAIQYTRLASLFLPVKHIACERGSDYDLLNLDSIISIILEPISDLIIFNSKVQMDKYSEKFRFKKIPLKTIVNAINVNDFQSKIDKSLLKQLNLPPETMLLGTIGNFSEHKNFEMFIDVCANLSKKFDYLHFIAVGDSASRKSYEAIVESRNLGKKISFLGYVKEIDKIISNLDMFLLTSIWEGMPNVIMESMASKVPVISTDIDGARELIDHGINGYLVKSKDVNGMVNTISNIISSYDDIDNITDNAFEKISNDFSIDKMVSKYQDIFSFLYEKK